MKTKLSLNNDCIVVSGLLTRDAISKAFEKKATELLSQPQLKVDLSAVERGDTAGLAWLLLLVEQANQRKVTLQFINIPEDLQKLAKLSAVSPFLPVE